MLKVMRSYSETWFERFRRAIIYSLIFWEPATSTLALIFIVKIINTHFKSLRGNYVQNNEIRQGGFSQVTK